MPSFKNLLVIALAATVGDALRMTEQPPNMNIKKAAAVDSKAVSDAQKNKIISA